MHAAPKPHATVTPAVLPEAPAIRLLMPAPGRAGFHGSPARALPQEKQAGSSPAASRAGAASPEAATSAKPGDLRKPGEASRPAGGTPAGAQVPGRGADQFKDLPQALGDVLRATPESEWHRLRVFLVKSEEEGELLELLPEMRRAMKFYPQRLTTRVDRGEISPKDLERSFARLHDSLHEVRASLHEMRELAGLGAPTAAALPGTEPGGAVARSAVPAVSAAGPRPSGPRERPLEAAASL